MRCLANEQGESGPREVRRRGAYCVQARAVGSAAVAITGAAAFWCLTRDGPISSSRPVPTPPGQPTWAFAQQVWLAALERVNKKQMVESEPSESYGNIPWKRRLDLVYRVLDDRLHCVVIKRDPLHGMTI